MSNSYSDQSGAKPDAETWFNKGVALFGKGQFEEAIACFDRAIEINPRYADAWYHKGVALGNLGRSGEEIACYDRAIEINPRDAEAWFNKGAALGNLGRIKEALPCLEKAYNLGYSKAREAIEICKKMLGRAGRGMGRGTCWLRAIEYCKKMLGLS